MQDKSTEFRYSNINNGKNVHKLSMVLTRKRGIQTSDRSVLASRQEIIELSRMKPVSGLILLVLRREKYFADIHIQIGTNMIILFFLAIKKQQCRLVALALVELLVEEKAKSVFKTPENAMGKSFPYHIYGGLSYRDR